MKTKNIIAKDINLSNSQSNSNSQTGIDIKVGLSACLAGLPVRYNGGHSQSKLCLNSLKEHFQFKTFCPEVAAGFSTPRPTMRLTGSPENPRLQYSDDNSEDLTEQLEEGFKAKLEQFRDFDGYILMKNSPSCGMERVKIYQDNGYPHKERGRGLFTAALMKKYPLMPVEEEGRLHDPKLCENFILRVYAHHHFREEVLNKPSLHNLIQFHSSYKYVLMAHNQVAYKALGKKLATLNKHELFDFLPEYQRGFMQAIAKPASSKNHTNTLLHILGYLKKSVSSEARQHIADIIYQYHKGMLPLITPMTLLKHYIQQCGNTYIQTQRYLQPYPAKLCLTNKI